MGKDPDSNKTPSDSFIEAFARCQGPDWKLRKTDWQVKNGILVGNAQDEGNGAFLRLHGKSTDGPLPSNYIMTFSFKATQGGPAKDKPGDPSLSAGHRFSLGHYTAKFQWRRDLGIDLALGHGHALKDDRFHIERDTWYQVTIECRGDEILTWFKDGPSYFLKRDSFLDKTPGWEFFVHKSEIAHLANLKVWSLAKGERNGWQNRKKLIAAEKRCFLSSEHPEFSSEKHK